MSLRFASKTVIFSFLVVLAFVVVTAFLLPTICIADKGMGKKKALGLNKEEVCHITGSYDFETETYMFGNGGTPIGHVIKIPESAYMAHLKNGHPETWKVVTLSDGSEVCVAPIEGERQFDKGTALFIHDTDSGDKWPEWGDYQQSILHLKPGMGEKLTESWSFGENIDSMTSFYIDGEQYVMGLSSKETDKGYYYFIQRIFSSGDFGPITGEGYFACHYKTLISLIAPGGTVYIYLQEDGNNNRSITHKVFPGGRLARGNADNRNRDRYYDAVTALPNNYHTCFFAQDSGSYHNNWMIDCIHSDGKFFSNYSDHNHDWGTMDHGYQIALSYRNGGLSHLFLHRHYLLVKGPWWIGNISDTSYMGDRTDSGTWAPNSHYKTMTVFPHNGMRYLFGHHTYDSYNWFIQHVSHYGHMDEEIDNGFWSRSYEHAFPIDFDTAYLDTDNWMERMFNDIEGFGDRKLSEIALPGSHDAGMNVDDIHGCHIFDLAGKCNTATQTHDIGGQLQLGARYFDIRPKIDEDNNGEDWTTGHVQEVLKSVVGCLGEGKSSIVEALNDFFEKTDNDGNLIHAKELVILNISHCTVPPQYWNSSSSCAGDQKLKMASDLATQLGDHVVKCDPDTEDNCLTKMTLDEILAKGNIILVVHGARDTDNGIFQWGYGGEGDYYIYDKFSNTEKFSVMVDGGINNSGDTVSGQKAKLLNSENHAGNNDYNGFLLSWTLTLSGYDATICKTQTQTIINDMAVHATPRLYEQMYKLGEEGKLTKIRFPNILYVDNFARNTTNTAIYLNKLWGSLPLWSSGTAGNPGAYPVMQDDGNYVIYGAKALWATGTNGNPGAYYVMQQDGNFVIYSDENPRQALWATGTGGNKGAYYEMQHDGNFVIYSDENPRQALWATGTGGNEGAYYVMQDDGNFVIYRSDDEALWATGTSGNPGAKDVMQHDGNFVIYNEDHTEALWATGTSGYDGAELVMQDDGNLVIRMPE